MVRFFRARKGAWSQVRAPNSGYDSAVADVDSDQESAFNLHTCRGSSSKEQTVSVGKTESGKKTKRKKKRMSIDGPPVLEPNAGGIDVGAREIYVSVRPERDEESVRI